MSQSSVTFARCLGENRCNVRECRGQALSGSFQSWSIYSWKLYTALTLSDTVCFSYNGLCHGQSQFVGLRSLWPKMADNVLRLIAEPGKTRSHRDAGTPTSILRKLGCRFTIDWSDVSASRRMRGDVGKGFVYVLPLTSYFIAPHVSGCAASICSSRLLSISNRVIHQCTATRQLIICRRLWIFFLLFFSIK